MKDFILVYFEFETLRVEMCSTEQPPSRTVLMTIKPTGALRDTPPSTVHAQTHGLDRFLTMHHENRSQHRTIAKTKVTQYSNAKFSWRDLLRNHLYSIAPVRVGGKQSQFKHTVHPIKEKQPHDSDRTVVVVV